ncbi:MAG: C10 family peptidase [Gemmatimonadota bacterium]|nr:MAG: C10 family peptidase [Gemmatimonadota bacterium]
MKRFRIQIAVTLSHPGFLPIAILLLFSAFAHSRELGEHEVKAAVETWVRYVTAEARPDAFVERMEPYEVDGDIVAYIAHLSGGGFCLCGASQLLLPVSIYSPRGKYDSRDPHCQYFLWEIENRLKCLREGLENKDRSVLQYEDILSQREDVWQDLMAGIVPTKEIGFFDGPQSMVIDMTCGWRQNWPYNSECPVLPEANPWYVVVGCTGTAMAQIMYYWRWPNTGMGSRSVDYEYRWTNNWITEPLANDPNFPVPWWPWDSRLRYDAVNDELEMTGYWDESLIGGARQHAGTLSPAADSMAYLNALNALYNRLTRGFTNCPANFGATTYRWDLMDDLHLNDPNNPADPLDAGDTAAAILCHHAGVAIDMYYGVMGSGAWLWHPQLRDMVDALEDNFRYDHDAKGQMRDDPGDVETMIEEIQWLRPVGMAGYGPGCGGHSFLAFGYNRATDQFLMNLGNADYDFWWFTVDQCCPVDQSIAIQLAPEDVVKFVGDDSPGDGSPNNPYENIEEAIDEAPDYATLIFKAGTINTYSAAMLVIDRPFTLKGFQVTIQED